MRALAVQRFGTRPAITGSAADLDRITVGTGRLAGMIRAQRTKASLAPRPRGSLALRDHVPNIKGQVSHSRSKVKALGPGDGMSQAQGPGNGTSQAGRTSAK